MVGFTSFFSRMRDARPSCKQPKTLSFRQAHDPANPPSAFFDLAESWPSSSSRPSSPSPPERDSFSLDPEAYGDEAIIRGLRSERLFFDPCCATSSIAAAAAADEEEEEGCGVPDPFEGSVAVAVDSEDPHRDFKRSMEEMLMAHGVRDWAWLEAMLGWYLRANGKSTHGIIIGAFVELFLSLVAAASPPPSYSSSSFVLEIEEEEISM